MAYRLCSRHNRVLECVERKINTIHGEQMLEYYQCPEPGCDYVKPKKNQLKPYTPRKPK